MTNRTGLSRVLPENGDKQIILSWQCSLLTAKCWNWTAQQMPVRPARLMRTAGLGTAGPYP